MNRYYLGYRGQYLRGPAGDKYCLEFEGEPNPEDVFTYLTKEGLMPSDVGRVSISEDEETLVVVADTGAVLYSLVPTR